MMKKKVLIVDAAQSFREQTAAMLEKTYDVVFASTGDEAVRVYERERPDLILTDLNIPHMSGFDLQRILQERRHELIPMMFMSSDENDENEIRALEGVALDYIRKPFKEEALLRRVGNILRHAERVMSLQRAAETDPMTGLLNKAHTRKIVSDLCQRASGMLMMVDLDSFKLVNDLYGHAMGDRVLIRFAEILQSVIRSADVAGRVGGDEFLLFCRDIREETIVEEKTRQINALLLSSAREFMGADMNIPLGASVGAVPVPDEGRDFSELYKKADRALYRVKRGGKHSCFIFREGAAPTEEEESQGADSLRQLYAILEERNRQPGAYHLNFDRFQTVFRYLRRAEENYHRPMSLALFTLSPPEGQDALEPETAGLFGETMRRSLRRSDVYTQSGQGQYVAIFTESNGENDDIIINRILGNWKKTGRGGSVRVDYETRVILR